MITLYTNVLYKCEDNFMFINTYIMHVTETGDRRYTLSLAYFASPLWTMKMVL